MNYERAMALVAALRSGKYEQTNGQLRKGDAFCCLGVACDISGLGEWDGKRYIVIDDSIETAVMPDKVRDWFGAKNYNPEYEGISLAEMNDKGKSFAEIADAIEAHWEYL